jgi:hypothetical protein
MHSVRYEIHILWHGARRGTEEVYHADGATGFHRLVAGLRQQFGPDVKLQIRAFAGEPIRRLGDAEAGVSLDARPGRTGREDTGQATHVGDE